jgi:type II secretory pathway predicted ATPase ExeA
MKMPSSAGIDRPFPSVPSCDRYLAIGSIEDARGRICRMIDRNEGLGVVIGPPGTGKTLLCQRIAAQYRSTFAVVMLGDIRVSTRMGLIQQVLFHLRQPSQGMDEQAMQLALIDCLTKGNDFARSLLLIIDEAQMLSIELLDEIRMLTNLIRDGRPLVHTLLVGNSRLEDPLADPQMESLSQRIAMRCYLHPMTHNETAQYIRSMLAITGLAIDDDAIASVHHACGGVPRLINQLMNQSLDFATLHRKHKIDDISVQHAWADLQQLPSPVLEPKLKPQSATIEFGDLDSFEAFEFDSPQSATAPKLDSVTPPTSVRSVAAPSASKESFVTELDACSRSVVSQYSDIESILSSPIICFAEPVSSENAAFDPKPSATNPASTPVQLKTTRTTIVPQMKKSERKLNRDELFGIDFSDEMLVDVRLSETASKSGASKASLPMTVTKSSAPAKNGADPASEEISLHSEILKMSHTAKQASESRSNLSGGALPWSPHAKIEEVTFDELPLESADVPGPMAVVWSDDEATSPIDDRDILVIEDEVTLMVDPPAVGKIGSGAMRQPPVQVERQYQGLFSRLRRGE